jgi:Domain of unknown function (DUF4410)
MTNSLGRNLVCCLGILSLIAAFPAWAQGKRTYKQLFVQPFVVPDGADFPSNFAVGLRHNIVRKLVGTKRFENVTLLDRGQPVPANADLVLSGKITKFNAGSRMARYMVPGLGQTKIRAEITFSDPTTQKTILEQEVHGTVAFGVFGGDSMGATNGVAKGLAKAVKKELP